MAYAFQTLIWRNAIILFGFSCCARWSTSPMLHQVLYLTHFSYPLEMFRIKSQSKRLVEHPLVTIYSNVTEFASNSFRATNLLESLRLINRAYCKQQAPTSDAIALSGGQLTFPIIFIMIFHFNSPFLYYYYSRNIFY